jgi:hypothetical protein
MSAKADPTSREPPRHTDPKDGYSVDRKMPRWNVLRYAPPKDPPESLVDRIKKHFKSKRATATSTGTPHGVHTLGPLPPRPPAGPPTGPHTKPGPKLGQRLKSWFSGDKKVRRRRNHAGGGGGGGAEARRVKRQISKLLAMREV